MRQRNIYTGTFTFLEDLSIELRETKGRQSLTKRFTEVWHGA